MTDRMPPTGNRPPRAAARRPAQSTQAGRYARLIPDLRPGEVVVALFRRHPVALLSALAWPLASFGLWAASAIFVVPFLQSLHVDPLLVANPPPAWVAPLLWTLWLGSAVFLLSRVGYIMLDWREDWIALTSRRLIVMNKTLFVSEARRECPINKVQNVTAGFPNPVGMAFDFGDLQVDTSGAGTISFKDLPRPKVMREAIFKQQEIALSKQPPPEDLRRAAVRSIILGQEPGPVTGDRRPATGDGRSVALWNQATASNVSGYGLFNLLFPVSPQRAGSAVTWHKHWSYLLRGLLVPLVVYVSVLAGWFVSVVLIAHGEVGALQSILQWLVLALFPICAGWALWDWEDWRNDLYRLDHERVYHIESLPFGLREQSKETLINRISDVMYVVPGPLANMLNYGTIVIKTPGEATEFDFKGIPCPREVQQEIMERVDYYRQKSSASADKEIEAWLKAYHDVSRGA